MMVQQYDLGGFEPCHEAHAIVAAAISVAFSEMVGDAQWPAVRAAVLKAASEMGLGIPQPFYGLTLTFDPHRVSVNLNAPSPGANEIAGLAFSRLGENEALADRIIVARESIIVQTYTYVRWEPFRERARRFLELVYPSYRELVPYAATKLEYWDRFDHSGEGVPDASRVIRFGNDFIAKGAADPAAPWHSHIGFFQSADGRVRRLVNLRVDTTDTATPAGSRRSISIYTMAQDAINAPGYEPTDGTVIGVPDILSSADVQHTTLKDLLGGVITGDAAARIGLPGASGDGPG